jgi:hypothetical protein
MESESNTQNLPSLELPKEEIEDTEGIFRVNEEIIREIEEYIQEEIKEEEPVLEEIKIDEVREENNVPSSKNKLLESVTKHLMYLYKGLFYFTSCSLTRKTKTTNEPL